MGWWAIDSKEKSGHMVIMDIYATEGEAAALKFRDEHDALPENEQLCIGDGPADIMGDAIRKVIQEYQKCVKRPPYQEELDAVWAFCSQPRVLKKEDAILSFEAGERYDESTLQEHKRQRDAELKVFRKRMRERMSKWRERRTQSVELPKEIIDAHVGRLKAKGLKATAKQIRAEIIKALGWHELAEKPLPRVRSLRRTGKAKRKPRIIGYSSDGPVLEE